MDPLAADDPRTIGEYRLLRRLGAGGMGRVYLGRSPGGRTVAVKAVHPHFAADEEFRARFRREVESARRVGGDWTAPVLDADPEATTPWVATGYVAGPSLQQAVAEYGPLPETTVRAMGAGLAEALRHVHGLGLVHRDVKPSNVLLTLDGPRLIDFGIARATDGTASLTSTGASVGSPGYMSPEQVLGSGVGGASDVFSLGAVLAYAATGAAPFPGDSSAALLYKVVHEEPELDGLDGELRELIAGCLAKGAADRPTPAELAGRIAGPAGGAAGMVRSGWLPGPLVEQVSRRAVELLELEPEGPAEGPADGPASGPVPFTTPSEGPYGAFGPPDPSYYGTAKPTGPGNGRPGLSLTAGAERSRRGLSCTLALSVAGALAAVTIGSYFFGLFPGQDSGSDSDGGVAQPPPASEEPATSGGSDGEAGEQGAVPKAFLGTWTGDVRKRDGTPHGTMSVTISKGSKGDEVLKTTYEFSGYECGAKGTLESATEKKLTATEESDGRTSEVLGIPLCTGATATVTLTLKGDKALTFVSDDAAGGKPTSELTRVRD
ncbi:serine/threonine-protein kinase [Streptomyces gobiensis]|uniref:serine/threonine-protein kinase n=1 Tax=Streptomyces gobiensis TaxID=2875706 RepID=UPI001E3867F6|nr:serine/threonine-protein kinase [Streptomyces gobiensis]UGY92962.1 serine/threonine protein kinase [Streptomyces gobiensis]